MKLAFLTPGTGSYYCGACMRDNALAKSLVEAGHEVSLLPMYLPLQLDEEALRLIGEKVGERIQGTFIGTLLKRARTMGPATSCGKKETYSA